MAKPSDLPFLILILLLLVISPAAVEWITIKMMITSKTIRAIRESIRPT